MAPESDRNATPVKRASAKTQGQAELQEKVAAAKESAKNAADNLKSAAADTQGEASNWWGEVQNNWKSHIDTVRANADEAKANLDAKVVVRRADRAEDDAAAVEFRLRGLRGSGVPGPERGTGKHGR